MQRARVLTLSDAVFPQAGILRDVALVVGFSWVTALFAQIAVYIGPVPITGQTLAVLLCGAVLGSRRGAMSQLAYMAQGAAGLPVFAAGHGGVAYMMGPTGGYLLGFVVAVFGVGLLSERGWDRHVLTTGLAMVLGNIIIYAFGLMWLAQFALPKPLLQVGLIPFIPGDLIKIAIAATVLPSAWALLHRR